MSCAYCKAVNTICYWGPRPEKKWKRPWLFVLSLIGAGSFGSLLWFLRGHENYGVFALFAAFLVLASVLGIAVSLRGCDSCVARLMGEL
jgi:hypothetical protein